MKDMEKVGTTIFIPNGDHEIPARIELPANATQINKVPAVVILHGTGTNKDEVSGSYKRLAKMLAREGIASIRIDFLGHGESTGLEKDFNFANARSDILAATEKIRQYDGVDKERIGIIGWSQGGGHAYLAAANQPGYKSVVTWATGAKWPLAMLIPPGAREEAEKNGFAEIVEVEWNNHIRHLGWQWIKDIESLDIRHEVTKIEAPVLAIVGTEDFMSVDDIEQTVKACKNKESKMYVIEGGNHTFNTLTCDTRVFYQAADATLKWLKETL
jgi:uncharacterized protein